MPQKKGKLCPNNPDDHLIPMTIGDNCLSRGTPWCSALNCNYDNLKSGCQGKIGLDKE